MRPFNGLFSRILCMCVLVFFYMTEMTRNKYKNNPEELSIYCILLCYYVNVKCSRNKVNTVYKLNIFSECRKCYCGFHSLEVRNYVNEDVINYAPPNMFISEIITCNGVQQM